MQQYIPQAAERGAAFCVRIEAKELSAPSIDTWIQTTSLGVDQEAHMSSSKRHRALRTPL